MAEYTLLLMEAVEIQRYIFASNVLRENVGASDLVRCATRIWPLESARECSPERSNVKPGRVTGTTDDLIPEKHIEDGAVDLEVLYAWGGSIAVLGLPDVTRTYLAQFSRRVLTDAPGLELAAVQVGFDRGQSLASAMETARNQMASAKRSRTPSAPLLGLGPTLTCQSTGMPAVGTDGDAPGLKPPKAAPRPISASVLAKLQHVEAANDYLKGVLPSFGAAGLEIPYDFDHLGRSAGEMSYIAVVHADGNHMGSRIDTLRKGHAQSSQNRAYITAMRDYTGAVDKVTQTALKKMSGVLLRHRHEYDEAVWIVGEYRGEEGGSIYLHDRAVRLTQKDDVTYIPFRPIAFGGDDFTFVSDGRLGLALAALYLRVFEAEAQRHDNPYLKGATASAGVAVVKTHYPFARAYDLADELCRSAKDRGQHEHGALDWHFAMSDLFGELRDIRQRQYVEAAGDLVMRPVLLDQGAADWRCWPAFVRTVCSFQIDKTWEDKRNKVLALRQALRGGTGAVEHFLTRFDLLKEKLPVLINADDPWRISGWDGTRCVYFDAVEALDFFVPLYDKQEASHD